MHLSSAITEQAEKRNPKWESRLLRESPSLLTIKRPQSHKVSRGIKVVPPDKGPCKGSLLC